MKRLTEMWHTFGNCTPFVKNWCCCCCYQHTSARPSNNCQIGVFALEIILQKPTFCQTNGNEVDDNDNDDDAK